MSLENRVRRREAIEDPEEMALESFLFTDDREENLEQEVVVSETTKKSLWEDDQKNQVDLNSQSRLKKLKTSQKEGGVVSMDEYELRLRMQYQEMHNTPKWAKTGERKSKDAASSSDDEDGNHPVLSRNETVSVMKLPDVNTLYPISGKMVSCMSWKSSDVLATVSSLNSVSVWGVNDDKSTLLQTIELPKSHKINDISFITDSLLAIIVNNRFIMIWDVESKQEYTTLKSIGGKTHKNLTKIYSHKNYTDKFVVIIGDKTTGDSVCYGLILSSKSFNVVGNIRISELIVGVSFYKDKIYVCDRLGCVYVYDKDGKCVDRIYHEQAVNILSFTIVKESHDVAYFALGSNTGVVDLCPIQANNGSLKSFDRILYPIDILVPIGFGIFLYGSSQKANSIRIGFSHNGHTLPQFPKPTQRIGIITTVSSQGPLIVCGNKQGKLRLFKLNKKV
jgi:hypothetical protein